MEHSMAVHPHDRRPAVRADERAYLTDALAHERRVAASEHAGLDELVAVEDGERARVPLFEVALHVGGTIGVYENAARLARERVAEHGAQIGIGLEIDEARGIDARVAMICRQEDQRVATAGMRERAREREVEPGALGCLLARARTVPVRGRIDAGPVRVHVARRRGPWPSL